MAGSASLFSGLFPNFVFLLSSSPLTPKKNRSEVHEAGQEARDEAEELITKASKQFRLEVEKAEHRLKQFESESAAAASDRCFDSGAELCAEMPKTMPAVWCGDGPPILEATLSTIPAASQAFRDRSLLVSLPPRSLFFSLSNARNRLLA